MALMVRDIASTVCRWRISFSVLLTSAAIIILVFVRWQFQNREEAYKWASLIDDRLCYEFSASVGRQSTTAPCQPVKS